MSVASDLKLREATYPRHELCPLTMTNVFGAHGRLNDALIGLNDKPLWDNVWVTRDTFRTIVAHFNDPAGLTDSAHWSKYAMVASQEPRT